MSDHFGWHNICCYIRHHAAALKLAASASGKEDETFRRALYTNAFADHFLTDGFAAGHIRVPRAEICAWADAQGLSEKVAGALSKLLHDQDGHVNLLSLHGAGGDDHRSADDGLLVQDSTGTSWRTFCDGQLFLRSALGQCAAVDRAVEAVSASLFEFLLAWKRRELPTGLFEATRYVPFPHAETPALVQKFPSDIPDAQLDPLWASVGWYAKIPWIAGLERKHVQMLFKALPQIMADFRAHIATAAADVEINRRITPTYIAAYKQIA
jgi:hypothetical protein